VKVFFPEWMEFDSAVNFSSPSHELQLHVDWIFKFFENDSDVNITFFVICLFCIEAKKKNLLAVIVCFYDCCIFSGAI